jgi:NDP-sugar pyrophosphorylase family protein
MRDVGAVILAGGKGTRLTSVWAEPKCLVPVGGRPVLRWVLDWAEAQGIHDITLALAHRATEVWGWVEASYLHTLKIRGSRCVIRAVIEGSKPVGVARAISMAVGISPHSTIVVMNGDTIIDGSIKDVITHYDIRAGNDIVSVVDNASQKQTGILIIDKIRTRENADPTHPGYIENSYHLPFIDVGTPKGLARARAKYPR